MTTPSVFAVVAQLVADLHDTDPELAWRMWRQLTPDVQYRCFVVLACQMDPQRLTLSDLKRRVDYVAGVRADG